MYFLGEIIGILFMLVWIPYAGWKAGTAFGWVLSTPIRTRTERLKKTINAPKPLKKKISPSSQAVTPTCSINDGCATLGVSLEILKSYIAKGTIRTYKEGDSLVLNKEDVIKVGKNPGKRVFPVLDGYRDEYKITHPVMFDA